MQSGAAPVRQPLEERVLLPAGWRLVFAWYVFRGTASGDPVFRAPRATPRLTSS